MSLDWALPALRWTLYADLALVFGVPSAALLTGCRDRIAGWRGALALAALAGVALSLGAFIEAAAAMSGLALGALDRGLVLTLLTGTGLGWALLARAGALLACAGLCARSAGPHIVPLILSGGLAVATLPWSGHAAASEGLAGWIRIAGDALHLLAALTWAGALVLFAVLLWASAGADKSLERTARTLSTFALTGSVIVGLLVVSGLANLLFLLPPSDWPRLLRSLYGRLLLVKLALFVVMLVLAAANRFALVPALASARHGPARLLATRRLRISVTVELSAALAILGLVAWFGTLDPLGAGS